MCMVHACMQEMDSVLADRRALQQQVAALSAQHEAHVQALLADKAGMQVAASTCGKSIQAQTYRTVAVA